MSDQVLILEWIDDAIGKVWCVVALTFIPSPLFIALLDPWIGAVASIYSLFWVWRAQQSWQLYKSQRAGGKSREEWRHEEILQEELAARAARERILRIVS